MSDCVLFHLPPPAVSMTPGARLTADTQIIAGSCGTLRAAGGGLHRRLAANGINLSLEDRHRASRTAGYDRPLSAQPDPQAVAGPGAVHPKLEIVGRNPLNAHAILQVVDIAPRGGREPGSKSFRPAWRRQWQRVTMKPYRKRRGAQLRELRLADGRRRSDQLIDLLCVAAILGP